MAKNFQPLDAKGAFLLSETTIRQVYSSISEFTGGQTECDVTFESKFSFKSDKIEEVLGHPRFRSERCIAIDLSSRSVRERSFKTATFKAQESYGLAEIRGYISSELDDMHKLIDELSREIKGSRASYELVHTIQFIVWPALALLIWLSIAVVTTMALIEYGFVGNGKEINASEATYVTIFTLGITAVLMYYGNNFREYLFPRFQILVGKGLDLNDRKKDTRKWILRAAAVPLIGAAISLIIKFV